MEKILNILQKLKSGVDFETEEGIISNGLLDSIGITSLIASLEEEFDIEIGMEYMENSNFESVNAIYNMVQELIG